MISSVDNLKSIITTRGGMAKPNRFMVDLSGLSVLKPSSKNSATSLQTAYDEFGITPQDLQDLQFLVESVNIPGRSISTFEYASWNHPIKIPTGYDEDDVEFVFSLTADFLPKRIFDFWHNLVIDQRSYLTPYEEEYKFDIKLYQLNDKDKAIYGAHILGAYPTSVKGVFLDNNAESTISRFSTTVTFNRFNLIKSADLPQF